MTQNRIKGFVVGYDRSGGELLWTVRAKDRTSNHDGHKFAVASFHQGTMLTKSGVDVTFKVHSFGQEKELKAVNVSLGLKDPYESEQCDEYRREPINFMLVEDGGNFYAMFTECVDEEDARATLKLSSDEAHLVTLLSYDPMLLSQSDHLGFDDETMDAFEIFRPMMYLRSTRNALEAIVTQAFKLGKTFNFKNPERM
jgi:hypothetical protein